jgi:4-aminobutyrate aminotransferase-like enzyme
VPRLERGDLLPELRTPLPGPASIAASRRLRQNEAPGVNTLLGAEPSLVWQEALGANVLDLDGNRLLDLTSGFGVASVGHRHPRVVAAVCAQAQHLVHGMGDVAAHPPRLALATKLVRLAPVDDACVYFAISGSDAVEVALKACVLATGRPAILAFSGAYHGVTLGALVATAREAFRAPFAAHLHPHLTRLSFGAGADEVRSLLATGQFGAVIVEPILGREGVVMPPAGWLQSLRVECDHAGALLILDEVFTGFGKTGAWFVAQQEGVRPDILCCGKALGGGLPIAAAIARRAVFSRWPDSGEALHTATFLAHPLACAAALATLAVIEEEGLVARAARLGDEMASRLRGWPARFPVVRDARGRGLLWGVELEPDAAVGVALRVRQRGVLALSCGPLRNVLQLAPPLTITDKQLRFALAALEDSLAQP